MSCLTTVRRELKWLVLPLALLAVGTHAEVYRSITPDGRVVYTDNADTAFAASQDASKILVMDQLNPSKPVANIAANTTNADTVTMTNATTSGVSLAQPADANVSLNTNSAPADTIPMTVSQVTASRAGEYQLAIVSPSVDMAYRKPAQPIEIEVKVSPSLKQGDRLVYEINGKHIATTQETRYQVSTQDYLPEYYTLTVKIENIVGDVIASQDRPFYILQNNFVLQKKRKAAAEAKAAYDKLPWYRKIKININL